MSNPDYSPRDSEQPRRISDPVDVSEKSIVDRKDQQYSSSNYSSESVENKKRGISDGGTRQQSPQVSAIDVKQQMTTKEVFATSPRTLKDRWHYFLYKHGLSDKMPDYLKHLYLQTHRKVFVNMELPPDFVDEHGKPIIQYPRNKIRTTKYTPLSFFPKNIYFQFTNIANTYFLILIILGAFQIFGVASPGLAAVPLVVIVCVTAAKDAFEDYRRRSSDSELNNSPIHLLNGLENPNVLVGEISAWRRFKKACFSSSRIFFFTRKSQKRKIQSQGPFDDSNILSSKSSRVSAHGDHTSVSNVRNSLQIPAFGRPSMASHRSTKFVPNTIIDPQLFQGQKNRTSFKNRHWKDISVGDIIRVRANEEVPADIIILSTSDVEGNCYIETRNLDGESNLKGKMAMHCSDSAQLKHAESLANVKFWVECDAPNGSLYNFKGTIHYENYDANGQLINPDEKEVITIENVLLRGSTLRNTDWVIGLVVYTGDETKIMINSGITPTKQSRISRELNLSVIINFALLFVLCFVSGLVNGLYYNERDNSRIFFELKPYGSTSAARGVIAFFVALIIYQSLVPISLYISVEIIKTLQAFFIFSDIKMYYAKLDFPCIPKSWNISDDLGQIEYVFSDKTGTLTQNVMEFRKCTINGKAYGLAYTEAKQGLDKRAGLDPIVEAEKWKKKIDFDRQEMLSNLKKYSHSNQLRDDLVTFCSSEYVKDTLVPETIDKSQKQANESFMLTLALCHTVVTEPNVDDPELRDFKAESPDEAALVSVARDVGIVFKEKYKKRLVVELYGQDREYIVHTNIAFTSARKRMSSIIETPEGKFYLLTKGADNVIYSRLSSDTDDEVMKRTAIHLETFANEGLRTLCIAHRELDPSYALEWLERYKRANESIADDRDIQIDELSEEIETDLILLGGTAIEDRLQDGVPDSIQILGKAGIKLWVLTGDRVETAINIGFSCNLLENEMSLLVIKPDEESTDNAAIVDELLTKHLLTVYPELSGNFNDDDILDSLIKEAKKDHSAPADTYGLVISGAALGEIFDSEKNSSMRKKFILLGKKCKSVLCCRVSPSQKASVVKLVRDSLSVMTLAIGDGANDVAMIQAANVGVGIAGEEGRQAVMSSDYAIGQFRYIARLLLVHGRWSYKRLAEMVPCFFYKNVVFTLTCFWFGIYTNYDGSYLYEYTFLMFYNLAFTSLPVIFLAVLDQDVSDTVSLLVPQLYRSGILRLEWSQYKFIYYMLDGLYQSVISFYFPYLLFYVSFQNPQGLVIDHRFWIGAVVACLSVTACNIYVLLKQYRWDWLSVLINALSILFVFFWTGVWSCRVYSAQEFYKAGAQTLGTLSCWCTIFIGILICVLPRFTFDFLKRNFKPKDVDIVREQVRAGMYDEYPEGYDPTNKDDVEMHRLGMDKAIVDEKEIETPTNNNAVNRTLKSIKRKLTISKKPGSHNSGNKKLNRNLEELRREMLANGELQSGSLSRIATTQELPGLTQAETLLSYHSRRSIQVDRNT